EEALVVDLAEVAGVEPAVLERLGGRLLVAPVLAEHDAAGQEHLAVLGDARRRALDRPADRADLERLARVDRGGGGRLGEAVALEHGNPDATEEGRQARAERGGTGHGGDAAAAV